MISESRALVYTKSMNSGRNRWIWSLDLEQNEPFPRKSSSEFDKMLEFDKNILFPCQKKVLVNTNYIITKQFKRL